MTFISAMRMPLKHLAFSAARALKLTATFEPRNGSKKPFRPLERGKHLYNLIYAIMKTVHDFSEVKLCADDFFRFLEALSKDGFRFEIRNPYRVSPRPRLCLAFHGYKFIQSNSIDVPFTFGEMDFICNRWIPEFFGVECSHLANLIARMTICFAVNSPFPTDYEV